MKPHLPREPGMELLLDLKNIRREFGAFVALHDVTLALPTGRIGLLGPNGAGKSTLLKLLMGLIPPTSGQGIVLGQKLGDEQTADNWKLRQLIGFMPEADALVPGLKGIEYVSLAGQLYGMPKKQAERRAHEVLGYLELEEARYRRVEEYSIGMKQRVKLAQALIHDPPALLLDEPTSGLDPAGRDAMLRLIQELGTDHGKSIILSTHLLADVQAVCDRVVVMAAGNVRAVGSVEELCAKRDDCFRVRIDGNIEHFRSELVRRGVTVQSVSEQGDWRIVVPQPWNNTEFFRAALASNTTIRSLLRDDETLEEMFFKRVD